MVVGRAFGLMLLTTLVILLQAAVADVTSVMFDKTVYDRDDIVHFSVYLDSVPARLAIEARAPSGELVWVHEEQVSSSPVTFSFKLPGLGDGVYTLYVAVDSGTVNAYTFTVKRPTFSIVDVTPTELTVNPGQQVTVKVKVVNTGATGSFVLRLLSGATVVKTVGPFTLDYGASTTIDISFTAPAGIGIYTYKIEIFNVKYNVVDAAKSITLTVARAPAITPTPTPTPAPTVTASPTPLPGVLASYVVAVEPYISPAGVFTLTLVVVVPDYNVVITFPQGSIVTLLTGERVRPSTFFVKILSEPPSKSGDQVPVGIVIDASFDVGPVLLSTPALVELPYDPAKVPPGYVVRLAYYDPGLGKWVALPTISVDPVRGVVTGYVSHFSIIAPVAFSAAPPATVTVTMPVTATATATVTVTATRTEVVTETATVTATAIATETITTPVTTPVTVKETVTETITRERIVVSEATKTVTETIMTPSPTVQVRYVPTPTTVTVEIVPGWVWAVVAAAVIVAAIAAIMLAMRMSKPR